MWAETDKKPRQTAGYKISIHSARVGGDFLFIILGNFLYISIHSARVGGDVMPVSSFHKYQISIHSARVGGDVIEFNRHFTDEISIHSARVGGDGLQCSIILSASKFQSTPPVWAETHNY